jgi:hypothetical protein
VYIAATNLNQVLVWPAGSNTPTQNISAGLNLPCSVIATSDGDIYVDNGGVNNQVDKWTLNATSGVMVMNVSNYCLGLFIDINDTLYCTGDQLNKVVKVSLNSGSSMATNAAGNGTVGAGPYLLDRPTGIFVDINLNLYVSDYGNNRIQMFQSGQLLGSTLAGNGAPGTITLNGPNAVLLDADDYLFIADTQNNRIVASGLTGYRCIIGCSGGGTAASNQLYNPQAFSFDSFGNIFVADRDNNRVQKFLLATNSCGKRNYILLET